METKISKNILNNCEEVFLSKVGGRVEQVAIVELEEEVGVKVLVHSIVKENNFIIWSKIYQKVF